MWITSAEILERVWDQDSRRSSPWAIVGELKEKLLRREFAETNPQHLRKLRRLCDKAGIGRKDADGAEESTMSRFG